MKVSFNAGITYTTVGRFMETVFSGGDLINDLNLNGIADSGNLAYHSLLLLNIHLIFQVREYDAISTRL